MKTIKQEQLSQLSLYRGLAGASLLVMLNSTPALAELTEGEDASIQNSALAIDTSINTVIEGAHSRPLSHLVAAGEKTVWVAGDIGRNDHGNRSGDLGLAEISAGYNFDPVQINLSLGQTWFNQSLAFDGRANSDGKYVMLESIFPISKEHKVYGVVSATGHWSEADIKRGYIDLFGDLQSSKGDADSRAIGYRARVEWQDATNIADFAISPYADILHVKYKMDGYTEKTGFNLATFNSRSDYVTTYRLGFNASKPIAETQFNIVANAEVAHADSGNIGGGTGLINNGILLPGAFTLNGQDLHRDWVKLGLGVEGTLNNGKLSLMVNGTTNSIMPNMWVAASYQMNF